MATFTCAQIVLTLATVIIFMRVINNNYFYKVNKYALLQVQICSLNNIYDILFVICKDLAEKSIL